MALTPEHPRTLDDGDLAARCGSIVLLLMDVDGVMTDGSIIVDDHGVESKHFYVRDGSALNLWRKAGKRAAILSGRSSPLVERRAAELKIEPVIQGAAEKLAPFRALLDELKLDAGQVCYLGDDIVDLPVLGALDLGLAVRPADAVPEVLAVSHLVTRAPGGRGVVRETIETILRHQGVWDELVASNFAPESPR